MPSCPQLIHRFGEYTYIIPLDYLPTKRFLITGVLVVAVFAGWYFRFARNADKSGTITYSSQLISTQSIPVPPQPLSPEEQAAADEQTYFKLAPEKVSSDLYSIDVQTSPDELLHAYGLEIVKALAPITSIDRGNEPELMLAVIQKGTTGKTKTEIAQLQLDAQAFKTAQVELMKVAVPPEAAQTHLQLVNSMGTLAQLVTNMSQADKNPVLAVASGNQYTLASTRLLKIIGSVNKIFDDRGIVFADSEKANVTLYEAQQ